MKFMVNVWAAFLARVNPVSTMAKPACMNMTRKPVIRVHTKLIATVFAVAASAAALARESAGGAAGAACAARASGTASVRSAVSKAERLMAGPGVDGGNNKAPALGIGRRGIGKDRDRLGRTPAHWHQARAPTSARPGVSGLGIGAWAGTHDSPFG